MTACPPREGRTAAEVLAAAAAAMDAEDQLEAALAAWLSGRPTGVRRPRRRLRAWLRERKGRR
jgi:hypothetical protein